MLLRTIRVSVFISLLCLPVAAQSGAGNGSFAFGWIGLALLTLLAVGAFFFWRFQAAKKDVSTFKLDADEVKPQTAVRAQRMERKTHENDLDKAKVKAAGSSPSVKSAGVDFRQLPIGQIDSIDRPAPVEPLPESDDEGLLAAIEELHEDGDVDSDVRLIALRVLGGFKSRNSIDALSQIALYDLSGNLRSKAVGVLADIDHESVFETIILACADPSREVRAAGARALVKVTFDRADAWARFAYSDDKYLGRQMARAAVESGIAERSFDRLAMRDENAAYEAFTLVYLLIVAGETDKIFEAVKGHRELNVRLALLHSIKIANVAEVVPRLAAFIAAEPIYSEVADKAREALLGIDAVPIRV